MKHTFSVQNQSPWLVDVYNEYFKNNVDGFLVEIGVGHTLFGVDNIKDNTLGQIKDVRRCGSNTADLLDLGWSGFYIEPVKEYCDEAAISHSKNLDRLKIINLGASDCKDRLPLFLGDSFISNDYGSRGYNWVGRTVEVELTSQILARYKCPKYIDLMSIDVEGFEDRVIKGIDFIKHIPKIIIVEINGHNPIINEDIVSSLLPDSYVILNSDGLNAVWVNGEL